MNKSVVKTRKEWFEDLPEPARTMAINNTSLKKQDEHVTSMLSALDAGFIWVHTTEGHKFWEEIYLEYRYGKEKEGAVPSGKEKP